MAYWRSNANDRRVPNMTQSQISNYRFNYTEAWLRHEVTDSIFALFNDERNGGFRGNQYQDGIRRSPPSPPRSGSSRGSGHLFEGNVNFEGINFGRLSQGSNGSSGQRQGYDCSPKSLSQGSLPIMFTSSQSSSISNRSNPMTHFENQFMLHDQFRSSSQDSSQEPPWKRSRYDARTP